MLPVLVKSSADTHFTFEIPLSLELPNIKAHFPAHILVPAYMQLAWIDEAVKSISPVLKVIEFKSVKFIKEISPTWKVDLLISLKKPSEYKFAISHSEDKLSSGEFITNE
jgi:hypothetical protein